MFARARVATCTGLAGARTYTPMHMNEFELKRAPCACHRTCMYAYTSLHDRNKLKRNTPLNLIATEIGQTQSMILVPTAHLQQCPPR